MNNIKSDIKTFNDPDSIMCSNFIDNYMKKELEIKEQGLKLGDELNQSELSLDELMKFEDEIESYNRMRGYRDSDYDKVKNMKDYIKYPETLSEAFENCNHEHIRFKLNKLIEQYRKDGNMFKKSSNEVEEIVLEYEMSDLFGHIPDYNNRNFNTIKFNFVHNELEEMTPAMLVISENYGSNLPKSIPTNLKDEEYEHWLQVH